MTSPVPGLVCPCDADTLPAPTNLPELSQIAFRVGTYRDFRRAVLTPLAGETVLSVDGTPVWRTQGQGDLAVMTADWFAYLADILTFYNERIANEDYLRTARLPESVDRLIRLLGYRPRPAIGAVGTLGALVTAGQSAVLPKGLQFQSKPTPGQAPQTFELAADTPIGTPDKVGAIPPPHLLARSEVTLFLHPHASFPHFGSAGVPLHVTRWGLLLKGAVANTDPGSVFLLRARDGSSAPIIATVTASSVQPVAGGGSQTALTLALSTSTPPAFTAASARLDRNNQTIGVWAFFTPAASATETHLGSLVRQIRAGDWVLFTAPGLSPELKQVSYTYDAIWDATGSTDNPDGPSDPNHPVPMPHTVLGFAAAPDASLTTIRFDWISVGALLDQPFDPWHGAPTDLVADGAAAFPRTTESPALLQDANGVGFATKVSSPGGNGVAIGQIPDPPPTLTAPFQVLYNPLPVNRGRTVAGEILGGGDATAPGQDFTLSQSPVTYLEQGATWASTIALTVDGEPWTEVTSLYGQAAGAQVFITREDETGKTHVKFGDGVFGARLPTGTNNVKATYQVGAGAASPPPGKLTVIAQSWPGLRAVLNPEAVHGGADPDAPDQIRRDAPRSVLTFGRAVSVFDYEALAALVPGVTRARAVWAWNDARQRTLVTVYVGDDTGARDSAATALAAAGDPNRPILVALANAVPASLTLTLIVTPGMDSDAIAAAATAALTDPLTGLFGSQVLPIGQPVFDSQIEAAVLSPAGAVAIRTAEFTLAGVADPGPLHDPGEGGYFAIGPADIDIQTEPDPHG